MNQQNVTPTANTYFLPEPSSWPITGALGLSLLLLGIINLIHDNWYGHYFLVIGILLFIYMLYGWFSAVINEGMRGLHNEQMDRTYVWGMLWFIASEIFFFGAFFGSLFYARFFALPALGSGETHALLWPHFKPEWPLFQNPNPAQFIGPKEVINAWGIPALNTLLLISSAVAITWAIWNIKKNRQRAMQIGILLTIVLGAAFLCIQAYEYGEAYTHFNLTLKSGIYGTTFFMLTGFHAAHVTVGLIMLSVIFVRSLKQHFTPAHHFALEAVSWYWHFVDIVWVLLFVLVYWL